MAIKIQGTDVITDGRVLTNIEGVDNIIQQPANISPADNTTNVGAGEDGEDTSNFDFQLTISQFSALLGTADTAQFQISDSSDFSNIVLDEEIAASDNTQNTLTITDVSQVLTEDTTYYWRARYFDTGRKESLFSDPTEFTTAPQFIYVDTPSITTPTDGATGVGESTLQILAESSEFSVNNDPGTGDHESTDWQVATDSDFSNIIFESLDDTSNLTSIDISRSNFSENAENFIRVRHHGVTYGDSLYSSPASFTTPNNFIDIETPTITSPSEGDTVDSNVDLTVTSSSFNVITGSDTHQSTDWQVATDSDFSNIIFESLDDTSNLTSIDIPQSTLDFNDTYFTRVRYNSVSGFITPYSSTKSFSTFEQFGDLDLAAGGFTTYDSTNDELNVSFEGQDNWNEELVAVDNPNGDPFQVVINASTITASFDKSELSGTDTTSGHTSNIDIYIDGSQVHSEQIYDGDWNGEPGPDGSVTDEGFTHTETSPNPGRISVVFEGNTFEDNRSSGTSYADYDANFDVFEINPL